MPAEPESDLPILVYQLNGESLENIAAGVNSSGKLLVAAESLLTIDMLDQRLIIGLGQAAWIPPNCIFTITRHGRFSGWLCLVETTMSRRMPQNSAILVSTPLLRELASRLASTEVNRFPDRARCLAASLLVEEMVAADLIDCRLPLPSGGAIAQAAAILQRNPRATLDGLAQSVGLSKRTLTRRFQRETGLSMKTWVGRFQMYRARQLLSDGLTVTDTALEVGYDSLSAFITRFRRLTGETPMDFVRTNTAMR